ncbi:MAG: hypothetical protein LUP94_00745 [Candidatus Methanomethylicus sp.]|nr:hypothetical protein [Candidatus Methanomethylicus sp.]
MDFDKIKAKAGKNSPPAVILGGGITGLAAIRALGREGVPVYLLEESKTEAAYSRFCTKRFVVPGITNHPGSGVGLEKAISKLRSISPEGVLFPSGDVYAMLLSGITTRLGGYVPTVPRREVLELLINKKKFYALLEKMAIPHPATVMLEDTQKEAGIRNLRFPLFVKPQLSQQFFKTFQMKGFLVESVEELRGCLKLAEQAGQEMVLQEIVLGPPTSHYFIDGYMDRQGIPKAFFARRRLRMWPTQFGNSTLCESAPLSSLGKQKDLLTRFLKSIGYAGIFSAEFKRDSRDGIFKLLEINSRTSAWFSTLSAACGINIMMMAYLDALGEADGINLSDRHYPSGYRWLDLETDTLSAFSMVAKGELSAAGWLTSLAGNHIERYPFAGDDLYPFVHRIKNSPKIIDRILHNKP